MKNTKINKQRGFFDFELAIILLASSSTTAYVLTSNDSQDDYAQQRVQTETVVSQAKQIDSQD